MDEYTKKLKKNILKDLKDLSNLIENDVDFPHGEQDSKTLIEISGNIETCLNNWYY